MYRKRVRTSRPAFDPSIVSLNRDGVRLSRLQVFFEPYRRRPNIYGLPFSTQFPVTATRHDSGAVVG